MKHFLYRILCGLVLFILIPVVFTLVMQQGQKDPVIAKKDKTAYQTKETDFDEDILTGIIANEVTMETEIEALKAQAVIARTNCYRAIKRGEDLPEGLTKGEMIRIFGEENFSEYYSRLESSIEATKRVVMTYNGEYIKADFHKCSAGYTRNANSIYQNEDFPYLKSKDSRTDIISPDFLKVVFYTPQEFVEKGRELFGDAADISAGKTAAELLSEISVTKKDEAGYVTECTVLGTAYSGEKIRLLYDWDSSAFALKEVDGRIRVVTKGVGHGLGCSLYGADAMAEQGYSYKEILEYFYTEIEFVSQ